MFQPNDIITDGTYFRKVFVVLGDIMAITGNSEDIKVIETYTLPYWYCISDFKDWTLVPPPRVKFVPKEGKLYALLDHSGSRATTTWKNDVVDQFHLATGNCFALDDEAGMAEYKKKLLELGKI